MTALTAPEMFHLLAKPTGAQCNLALTMTGNQHEED